MSCTAKSRLLNELSEPFGFSYQSAQDIFTSRTDAWQRMFGHEKFYDLSALSMNMAFDCEPVYFNYQGKTWLIEFWKGQYKISTGAEVGIYHADSIIPPMLRGQTLFDAVPPEEMLPIRLRLIDPVRPYFTITGSHWWQAGFVMGVCSQPEDLSLEITLTFPNQEMCAAFTRALHQIGYKKNDILASDTFVQITFTEPKSSSYVPWDSWVESYVLWKSRIYCRLYLWVTKPFSLASDRLLYLYYFLPFAFGRTINIRLFSKHKKKRI